MSSSCSELETLRNNKKIYLDVQKCTYISWKKKKYGKRNDKVIRYIRIYVSDLFTSYFVHFFKKTLRHIIYWLSWQHRSSKNQGRGRYNVT